MKISKKESTLLGILILVIAGAIAYTVWNTFNPKLVTAKNKLAEVEAEQERIDDIIDSYASVKKKINKKQAEARSETAYLYDEQSNDETDLAIQTIALSNGLKVKSFNVISVQENSKNLRIECIGTFAQMNAFIQRINNYEYSLGIEQVMINNDILSLNLIAYHENKDVLREDFTKE